MYSLSPSALNLFRECPRCFWLSFHGKKRPDSIFPSLPSGMDAVLKKHFDTYMEQDKLPPELKLEDVKLFDDKELLKEWRSNFKGIRCEINGNVLRGAVDNLLVKKGKLIVLDYKTRGFPLKEDTADHYQDQLNIYNFLLRKNNHPTEDYAYLLFYHPTAVTETGEVVFHTDLVKMDIDIHAAEKLFKAALACLEGKEPKKSADCAFCQW